jgi:hypothetical protein
LSKNAYEKKMKQLFDRQKTFFKKIKANILRYIVREALGKEQIISFFGHRILLINFPSPKQITN